MTRRAAAGMTRHAFTAGLAVAALAAGAGAGIPGAAHAAAAAGTRPAFGTLWAVNRATEPAIITIYAPTANGNVAPIATLKGPHTGLNDTGGIAVTPAGALWAAESSDFVIDEYAPGAHGDAAPVATIGGDKTGLDVPTSIALAHDGSLWVMNAGSQSLSHFAAGAHGNVAPIATIAGASTGLDQTRGIALTPDDKHIWVDAPGNGSPSAVLEFATATGGDVAPVRSITGANTTLGTFPYGVAVNAAGQVIVGSDEPGALLTFTATANGNVAPIRSVSGPTSLVTEPSLIAIDALGNVWLPNYADGTVLRETPTAKGDVAPSRVIAGAKTKLADPNAVAVYAATPGRPRALAARLKSHHRVRLTWHAPASTGGGVLGYIAYAKRAKHRWQVVGQSAGTAVTVKGLRRPARYRFAVTAVNNAGSSARSAAARAS